MPAKKYRTSDDSSDHSKLVPPLDTLASRETIALRKYLLLLLSVQPPILDSLAKEFREQLAQLLNVPVNAIPVEKIKSRQQLWELILCRFLTEKPWEEGLRFRSPKATSLIDGDTNFRQVNVKVRREIAEAARSSVEINGTNTSAWVWTSFYWFAKYVCPPATLKSE